MADEGLNIFGFQIKRATRTEKPLLPSIVPPVDEDGAGYVTASAAHYGTYVDINGDTNVKDDHQLIKQYRAVSTHPEVDAAVENIVNEAIVSNENEQSVRLILDKVEAPDNIKKAMTEEFDNIVSMMSFQEMGHDMFKRWYIDGRMYHHLVVDEKNLKAGIREIRPIDAAKVRKVKQIQKKKDQQTGASIIEKVDEFYIYQDKPGQTNTGVKLSADSVSYVTSGLLDENRQKVVSYLQKALKPINQLRMMEDSLVIYRISRAPERRIFYIDVGNLPKMKAEQYVRDMMVRFKNKVVYNSDTGEIRDDRKFMTMLEDFWLPRREGGKGTEITTLPGGQNLSQIDDIVYFQKKLYKSLNVPIGRLEPETVYNLGRSTEISRDEIKFAKFVERLRMKFSQIFTKILERQLVLKGIVTLEEWPEFARAIRFDYSVDNYFAELKETEILRDRVSMLRDIDDYVGKYYSNEWVRKHVLRQTEEEIKDINTQVDAEKAAGIIDANDEEQAAQTQPRGT